jgi:hypothetical protein
MTYIFWKVDRLRLSSGLTSMTPEIMPCNANRRNLLQNVVAQLYSFVLTQSRNSHIEISALYLVASE